MVNKKHFWPAGPKRLPARSRQSIVQHEMATILKKSYIYWTDILVKCMPYAVRLTGDPTGFVTYSLEHPLHRLF